MKKPKQPQKSIKLNTTADAPKDKQVFAGMLKKALRKGIVRGR
jgi:hypothetical protein